MPSLLPTSAASIACVTRSSCVPFAAPADAESGEDLHDVNLSRPEGPASVAIDDFPRIPSTQSGPRPPERHGQWHGEATVLRLSPSATSFSRRIHAGGFRRPL